MDKKLTVFRKPTAVFHYGGYELIPQDRFTMATVGQDKYLINWGLLDYANLLDEHHPKKLVVNNIICFNGNKRVEVVDTQKLVANLSEINSDLGQAISTFLKEKDEEYLSSEEARGIIDSISSVFDSRVNKNKLIKESTVKKLSPAVEQLYKDFMEFARKIVVAKMDKALADPASAQEVIQNFNK